MTRSHPPEEFAGREPVTTRVHDRPWTVDLTTTAHVENERLVVAEAVDAVQQTAPGTSVELVTPARHGPPAAYLFAALDAEPVVDGIEYRGRCQCGDHATAVFTGDRESDTAHRGGAE